MKSTATTTTPSRTTFYDGELRAALAAPGALDRAWVVVSPRVMEAIAGRALEPSRSADHAEVG